MKKMKNKNGFTLVELLAVIVILAILVLLALPNVTGIMANSRKSAFRTEAMTIARDGAGMAFTNVMTTATPNAIAAEGTTNAVDGAIFALPLNSADGAKGQYMCISISKLISDGFVDKKNSSTYTGYVQVFNDGTNTEFFVKLGNGQYQISNKSLDQLANATNISDVVTANAGSAGSCPNLTAAKYWKAGQGLK